MPADSRTPNFNSAFPRIADLLACPACHRELRLDGDRVVCQSCGRSYPVVDGIPVLIAGRADPA